MFNSGFSILAHFLASDLPPRGLSFQKAQNKIKLLLSLVEIMEELHAILKPPPHPPIKKAFVPYRPPTPYRPSERLALVT